ncbi:MAG TPA: hypothetical protein VKY31_11930 [Terriglobia bacterium]|nr:hypothetical protein [Terriglobia bacterium]
MRTWDIRIWAAIGASVLLFAGVMWTIPFTPDAQNFTFDTTRRDVANARIIDLGQPVNGQLVDGSDTDFYRIAPRQSAVRMDVHMANGSPKLIPAVRVYDSTKNIVVEKSKEYLKTPGANLDCTFLAESNRTYYIQVFGQRNTTGPYTLTVNPRTP